MDIVKIVEGNNLRELIENALSEYGCIYTNLEINNYNLNTKYEDTIVTGNLTIQYKTGFSQNKDFEVNIGTHKDDLVLFDEFEVVIN